LNHYSFNLISVDHDLADELTLVFDLAENPKYAPTKPERAMYCAIKTLSASAILAGSTIVAIVTKAMRPIDDQAIRRLFT
jgi:hypothetical protein